MCTDGEPYAATRITSRYFCFSAEQATTTPVGGWKLLVFEGERTSIAARRKEMSQSQRSSSVSGVPLPILSLFAAGWYWGFG